MGLHVTVNAEAIRRFQSWRGYGFAGSCGGVDGPDALFSYAASVDGLHVFTLVEPEFDGVVYLVGDTCMPLDEWTCDPVMVESLMTAGQVVYIIVDSNEPLGGAATLNISGP